MKLSGSILSLKEKTKENVCKLYNSGLDLLHIDVMDNEFVPNFSLPFEEVNNIVSNEQKLDVHLMVYDVETYINNFLKLNPSYITFHLEATDKIIENINLIKNNNCKVGLSIKPNTKVEEIYQYLNKIDLVLVMSVEPGFGGQKFIPETVDKIKQLFKYRKENNLSFEIEIDGGINDSNIKLLNEVDIFVVGSYITNKDFKEQIEKLKK